MSFISFLTSCSSYELAFWKDRCLQNGNTRWCEIYINELSPTEPRSHDDMLVFQKACELKLEKACINLKTFQKRYSYKEIKDQCLKKDTSLTYCHQAGHMLIERKEIEEGLDVFEITCKKNASSESCVDRYGFTEERKKQEEERRYKEKITKMADNCKNGNSKVCIELSSIYYEEGMLDYAIKFTNAACVQGSDTGCKLQSNYILQKNGEEMVKQQEISNFQQSMHFNKLDRAESDKQLRESIKGIGESFSPAKKTNCTMTTKYNPLTKSYESDSTCQ